MTDIMSSERQILKFRLLALLAISLAFVVSGEPGTAQAVVLVSVMYLGYVLLLHTALARWPHPALVYSMVIADAGFLGILMRQSGGAASLVIVLVPLMVPLYAIYAGYRSSFFAATIMLIALLGQQLAGYRTLNNTAFFMQIPLFYLLAALSGYMAQGRIRRLEEQEALQRLVRLENGARSLGGAVRTIQETLDVGVTLQELADLSTRLAGLPDCLIGLLDRKSGALVTRGTTVSPSRLGVEKLDLLIEWPRDGSLADVAMKSHEPVAVRQAGSDSPQFPAWAERLNAEAILAIPLVSRSVDVGVIYYFGVPSAYAFSAREVALAEAFGEVVALVAVNAQLFEDVQATIGGVTSDLRPVAMPKAVSRPKKLSPILVGDLSVDIPNRQAKIAGRVVNLTPTEFDLLAALAESSGQAVDQEALLRRVWGEDYHGRSTVVDVGVHRLRRKIDDAPGASKRIITVRGSGYMLVPASGSPPRQVEER